MFVGRDKELQYLNKLYISDRFEFPVIYGRRRVGKTALINEFTKGKTQSFLRGLKPMQSRISKTSAGAYSCIGVSLTPPQYSRAFKRR